MIKKRYLRLDYSHFIFLIIIKLSLQIIRENIFVYTHLFF